MNNIFIVVGLIPVVVFLFFYFRKKVKATSDKRPVDNVAQEKYNQKKHAKNNFLSLSAKDKLDLSWQFIYDITQVILQKFSKQDQEEVTNIGEKLYHGGMRYQHVVDYGIKAEHMQERSAKKKVSQERQVS